MNSKLFLLSVLFLLTSSVFAQNFKAIDKHAIKAPKALSTDLPQLIDYLSETSTNDLEKVRSFYSWIIHNIKYDNKAYKGGNKRINHSNQDVLNRRKAVCYGYSDLFKEMCSISKIPCVVISGHPKMPRDAVPNLQSANHAWNAVRIEGQWYLLDATWGAGAQKHFKEAYFLTPPKLFILDHLPNDPMWQLLDCPISPEDFQKSENSITALVSSLDSCFHYQDSIAAFMTLSIPKQRIKTAQNSFLYLPNAENKKMLGSAYMDYNSFLTDRSSQLEQTDSLDAILTIQLEMIETCEKASNYMELFDTQKENLAYTHFNYGVGLYQQSLLWEPPKTKDLVNAYRTMLYHFNKAIDILNPLPANFLSQNAKRQLEEYIVFVELKLEKL